MMFSIFTLIPLNEKSKKRFNKHTSTVMFRTPWDDSWLSPCLTKINKESELVKAFPGLADVSIKDMETGQPGDGVADFFWESILIHRTGVYDTDLGTLVHEIQHFVQSFEGRDCGSSISRCLELTGGDLEMAELLYMFNVGEMEAREAAGEATYHLFPEYINESAALKSVVKKLMEAKKTSSGSKEGAFSFAAFVSRCFKAEQ
jgi:hypothetical protein